MDAAVIAQATGAEQFSNGGANMSGAVTASVIGGTIAAGAGLGSAAIQSSAAGKAANTQAQAAQNAAEYQKQATQQALQYQTGQNQQNQQNLAPYMQYGPGALSNLGYLLGVNPQSNVAQGTNTPYLPNQAPQQASIGNTSTPAFAAGSPFSPNVGAQSNVAMANPGVDSFNPSGTAQPVGGAGMVSAPISSGNIVGNPVGQPSASVGNPGGSFGSLLTPYQDFQAPTGLTMENDPGYQARLQLGTDALQRSAAARGNVLTGGTAKALDTYAQDYASNEYGNVYNRALQSYGANQGNYYTGQNNTYNRLLGLVNNGQTAATNLSGLGQSGANSIANTIMGGANAVNQQNNNAALATATGYQNQGSAFGNALSGAGNNFSNLLLLQQLGKNGGYGGGISSMPMSTGPLSTAGY